MEVACRSSEIGFFKQSFILASGNGFPINYSLCAFICSFSLLVDAIVEIRCEPIFLPFSLFLIAEAVFRASANGSFIECFIPASGIGSSAYCSFVQSKFCASGKKTLFKLR